MRPPDDARVLVSRNWQRGSDRYNAKLNADKVRQMRQLKVEMKARGERKIDYQLAAMFGVTVNTVYNAITKKTWAHIL